MSLTNPIVRATFLLLWPLLVAGGCNDDPFGHGQDFIISIEIARSCPVVSPRQSCTMLASAIGFFGQTLRDPLLQWTTTNSQVISVSGRSSEGTVVGVSLGSATVVVKDALGPASARAAVVVVPRR